ncbi:hypothetical protein MYX75_10815 [Acidobacteria bacterium AH-259-A15]|nr:hypothetical protein [Acidobacteria bacterium AH-259-A15]
MNQESTSAGTGLCKSKLLLEFWTARPTFLGYIRRRSVNPENAEDIFQEACLKFLASEAVFDYPCAAKAYFYRIIHSLITDQRRRARRRKFVTPSTGPLSDPRCDWDNVLLMEQVSEIIQQYLSPRDQHFLSVYLDPDLVRLKDKCHMLNLSYGTGRYHFKRIAAELQRVMREKP